MSDKNDKIEHGDFDPEVKEYTPLTDEQVADLAKRIYRNEVFISWQIAKQDQEHLLSMVFMPLMFIDEITRKQMIRDEITFLYAEMSQAGPRGINGYPIFYSMSFLNKTDGQRVHEKLKQIVELLGD